MMDEKLELYRTLNNSQDKYIYFMLAATITAIGFTITQTQSLKLDIMQIPVGLSLVCWGLSFWFGSLNRRYFNSTLYANFDLFRVQMGEHPEVGNHSGLIAAASEGIKAAMENNSTKADLYAKLQTSFFIYGAFFYICWHILEMYLRTKI